MGNNMNDPQWGMIFNSIPADLPSGLEPKRLTFSQRAFIADAVFKTLRPAPYPMCRTPEKCAGKGYCPNEIACND